MRGDATTRSPLVRFLDGFFQERNIKWMLSIGMLILVGSSLMLVVTHWQEYTPFWKHLILVGYTVAAFFAGRVSYYRLGLRRTGTFLMALVVLLLPISFAALHWVRPARITIAEIVHQSAVLGLLIGNLAFGLYAAGQIFQHFLRSSQPTFLASYLALCLAGALGPILPSAWWPSTGLLLWAVFTAGTVKVNRHVFWLTEERRSPRVFGFFPILLLGMQFVGVFVGSFAYDLSLPWMGLACVLVSLTVLITADTVASVFRQRTGDLVRPLPWSIVLPMLVGLGLCAAGVALAATGMPRPYALVPTAVLSAVLMAGVAYRTQKVGFVWAMLFAVVLAYNFSPVFFQGVAARAVHHGAVALRESRLPYAFYGLTYLPLLGVLIASSFSLSCANQEVFSRPIRQFAVVLSTLLLASSFAHPKAVFPVSFAMTGIFAIQVIVFQDRRLMPLAIGAGISAAYGLTSFAALVLGWSVPADMPLLSLAVMGLLLWQPGRWLDAWSRRLPTRPGGMIDRAELPWCQLGSLALALALAGVWSVTYGFTPAVPFRLGSGILLAVLLGVHALIWVKPGLGEAAIIFSGLVLARGALAFGVAQAVLIAWATFALIGLWAFACRFKGREDLKLARVFGRPAEHVSIPGLLCLLVLYFLPRFVLQVIDPHVDFTWFAGVAAVAWAFDAARRLTSRVPAWIGCLGVLGIVASTLAHAVGPEQAWRWLTAAWAGTALVAVPAILGLRRQLATWAEFSERSGDRAAGWAAIALPVFWCVSGILYLAASVPLVVFTAPSRVATLVALVGLIWLAIAERPSFNRQVVGIFLSWFVVSLALQLLSGGAWWLGAVSWQAFAAKGSHLALVAALLLLIFQWRYPKSSSMVRPFMEGHFLLLGIVLVVSLLATFDRLSSSWPAAVCPLTPLAVVSAVLTFVAASASLAWSACRTGQEKRVWLAEAQMASGILYLVLFGVLPMNHSFSLFAVLAGGCLAWAVGKWSASNPYTRVLSGPLMTTGMVLPAVTVLTGVARHVIDPQPRWLGVNSLALLLAAGFYFWRGLERGRSGLVVLSAMILNAALALVWRELDWSDPQFFLVPLGASILCLVQLLKGEIPEKMRTPLRYLGALIILVSPTFHIVGGSWVHLFSLMVLSVFVALAAIGLRLRPLVYTGTAFLIADLLAMVVRGALDRPNLLWFAGLALGAAVITLAAICENHREGLLDRLRRLAAELEAWE